MKPKCHTTIISALLDCQDISSQINQKSTVVTADLQLYKIALDVISVEQLPIQLRLGGMHWLMSFVGCIGHLMENTGLQEVLKMLSGKMFPNNVRALRLVVEELIRPFISQVSSFDDLL